MKLYILALFLFVGCSNQPHELGKKYNVCADNLIYEVEHKQKKQIKKDKQGKFIKCPEGKELLDSKIQF